VALQRRQWLRHRRDGGRRAGRSRPSEV